MADQPQGMRMLGLDGGRARATERWRRRRLLAIAILACTAGACGGKKDDDPGSQSGGASGSAPNAGSNAFGNPDPDASIGSHTPPRDASFLPDVGGCGHLQVRNLDLLFMVDNSGSMQQEQEALRREFPKMIRVLTTGDRDADGVEDFPPIAELHLGVVSSDLGLVGITSIGACTGLGDDGILENMPAAAMTTGTECRSEYPRFLTFQAGVSDPAAVASDFACISSLGTAGCGFEQQLETTLKALWPSTDDRITFVGDAQGFGTKGHGDLENAGFLRPSRGEDTSLLAVVLVTDEDDCSSSDLAHFVPANETPEGSPLRQQGLNVRCHLNPQNKFPIQRYVDGLRWLRPDSQNLVVFGAITGVPTQLVSRNALDAVDFGNPGAVAAFYDGILASPEMKETIDDHGTPDPQDDLLAAACTNGDAGKAYPARRIVEVAKQFGQNSVVQSICQDDFGPAVDAIVLAITRAVKNACIVM
jgi:hypothetical protein